MRRLFMVDFREKGVSKHQCLEVACNGSMTDQDLIVACHLYVGIDNELDSVVEVFADMTAQELNEISLKPESLFLPRKLLFANFEEIERCAKILRGVDQGEAIYAE